MAKENVINSENKEALQIKIIPTQKVNTLSRNLKAMINMSMIKQDHRYTYFNINTLYSLIKDDAMLLLEFHDLLYQIGEKGKSR